MQAQAMRIYLQVGDRTNSGSLNLAWHPYSVTYCGSTCVVSLLLEHSVCLSVPYRWLRRRQVPSARLRGSSEAATGLSRLRACSPTILRAVVARSLHCRRASEK